MEKNKHYSELGYKIWFKLKPLVRGILRIKVEGLENFPDKSGFIIAANHRSHLDPPVLNTISPFPVMFMAKEELFKIPMLGKFIEKAGAIPVERGKRC
jgi:1-acyl-sn-glycerol-3-phosphate acyltransferase